MLLLAGTRDDGTRQDGLRGLPGAGDAPNGAAGAGQAGTVPWWACSAYVASPWLTSAFSLLVEGSQATARNQNDRQWQRFVLASYRRHANETDPERVRQLRRDAEDYATLLQNVRLHHVRSPRPPRRGLLGLNSTDGLVGSTPWPVRSPGAAPTVQLFPNGQGAPGAECAPRRPGPAQGLYGGRRGGRGRGRRRHRQLAESAEPAKRIKGV